jgi:excinuclease UvrABC nuclease subunit
MMENRDRFVELPLRTSGVYALCLQGQVVYVGKSKNILARISTHRNAMRRRQAGKPDYFNGNGARVGMIFDRAFVHWCREEELDRVELEMINKYNPVLNTRLRRSYKSWVNMGNLGKRMEGWKSRSPESSRGFERRF